MDEIEIIGRSSSHFTRLVRIFAEELELAYRLVPVLDMTAPNTQFYGDNPAMKLPVMRAGDTTWFGAQNICRVLVERAGVQKRIIWPEQLRDPLSRNAQELVWHGMEAQVQLAFGIEVCRLPPNNPYFIKARHGLEGALSWLDAKLPEVWRHLPGDRDFSMFEASLFCLLDHLSFRPTVARRGFALSEFIGKFGQRHSALCTAYQFDRA
jgi:glutathione S-transferase